MTYHVFNLYTYINIKRLYWQNKGKGGLKAKTCLMELFVFGMKISSF